MPRRSMSESTAPVRVEPTSRASTRSPGSLASARYMRMPAKMPATLRPITSASRSPMAVLPPEFSKGSGVSDVDAGQSADEDEADRVEREGDDHRGLPH